MRKLHIDYIKAMLPAVGFTAPLLEIYPPAEKLRRMIPVAVLNTPRVTNKLDARLNQSNRIARLPTVINGNTKILQFLKRHFKQEFKYQLDIWISKQSIAAEVLSEPAHEGLVDKIMRYISENQTVDAGNYLINLDVGASGSITDEAENEIYKVFVEIIFRDGLYSVEQAETLAGATLEILPPVEVVAS